MISHRSQGIFGDFDLFEFEGVGEKIKLKDGTTDETRSAVCRGVTPWHGVTAGGHEGVALLSG